MQTPLPSYSPGPDNQSVSPRFLPLIREVQRAAKFHLENRNAGEKLRKMVFADITEMKLAVEVEKTYCTAAYAAQPDDDTKKTWMKAQVKAALFAWLRTCARSAQELKILSA